MKKLSHILIVSLCTLIISVTFTAIGYLVGVEKDFMIDIQSVDTLEKETIKASLLLNEIKYLENGQPNRAKELINMELNNAILTLDAILQNYPENKKENKETAVNLLNQIAELREKMPHEKSKINENLKAIEHPSVVEFVLNRYKEK